MSTDADATMQKILAAIESQGLKLDALKVAKPEYPAFTFREAFEKNPVKKYWTILRPRRTGGSLHQP